MCTKICYLVSNVPDSDDEREERKETEHKSKEVVDTHRHEIDITFNKKGKKSIEDEIARVRATIIRPTKEVNEFLKKYNSSELTTGASLADLVKRTELTYEGLKEIDPDRPELEEQVEKEVGIELKYEGYIKLQAEQVEKFKKLEQKLLPEDINYEDIKGLRLEARQKLNKIRPNSVGQASRISGVSPADISVLLIYLETYNKVK